MSTVHVKYSLTIITGEEVGGVWVALHVLPGTIVEARILAIQVTQWMCRNGGHINECTRYYL